MTRFDDPFQAIRYMIEANVYGLSPKEIATKLFPTCAIRTAENKLSRALNPENHDLHFDIEWVEIVMEVTGREEILHYWLDRRNYDPPRLNEIRRPVKTTAQLLEELKDEARAQRAATERLERRAEQLQLAMQEPGQPRKPARRR